MTKNRVTLTSIAKATGKSPQTVSKILNGGSSNTNVSETTRNLVIEAATRLGYKVNQAARAVRQGRVGSLGMLISLDSHRSLLAHDMIAGAVYEAEKKGFDLKIIHYRDDELKQAGNLPRIFRETLVDGFLVNYYMDSEFTNILTKGLQEHNIPAIWMNRGIKEDCINYDDYNAGYELTKMMLADGLSKIAYIDFHRANPDTPHYSLQARPEGYEAAMKEANLRPNTSIYYSSNRSSLKTLESYRNWYKENRDVESIIIYGHRVDPAMLQVIWENNLTIGKDVHLGYFGHPHNFTLYPIYIMVQPEWTFGREAIKMLCDKIDTPKQALKTRSVKFCKKLDHPFYQNEE